MTCECGHDEGEHGTQCDHRTAISRDEQESLGVESLACWCNRDAAEVRRSVVSAMNARMRD